MSDFGASGLAGASACRLVIFLLFLLIQGCSAESSDQKKIVISPMKPVYAPVVDAIFSSSLVTKPAIPKIQTDVIHSGEVEPFSGGGFDFTDSAQLVFSQFSSEPLIESEGSIVLTFELEDFKNTVQSAGQTQFAGYQCGAFSLRLLRNENGIWFVETSEYSQLVDYDNEILFEYGSSSLEVLLTWFENSVKIYLNGLEVLSLNRANYDDCEFTELTVGSTENRSKPVSRFANGLFIYPARYEYEIPERAAPYNYSPNTSPVFYSNLRSRSQLIRQRVEIENATQLSFENEGFTPGSSGFLDFSQAYDFPRISHQGSLIVRVQTKGLAMPQQLVALSQSEGDIRGDFSPFLILSSADLRDKVMFYQHPNHNIAGLVDVADDWVARADFGLNSNGTGEFSEMLLSWNEKSIQFWVDGVLYYSFDDLALPYDDGVFQRVLLGGDGTLGFGDYRLIDFAVFDEPYMIQDRKQVVVLGDSFYSAGYNDVPGYPRYNASWGWVLKKELLKAGIDLHLENLSCSGHGWATQLLEYPTTDVEAHCVEEGRWLGNYVESISQTEPDIIISGLSVNDRPLLGSSIFTNLASDVKNSIERLCLANPNAEILFMNLFPWTKADGYDDPTYIDFTLAANEILAGLNSTSCGDRLHTLDIFNLLGGFDYDPDFTIGSALPVYRHDFHPSAVGHVAWGKAIAEELMMILRN